jgi:hypothetical protein
MPIPDDDEIIDGFFAEYAPRWVGTEIRKLQKEDPERLWRITLSMINQTSDQLTLAYIAAGLLEDLLAKHGDIFIDRVESMAKSDPQFLRALNLVWGQIRFKPDIYSRVQAVIKQPH